MGSFRLEDIEDLSDEEREEFFERVFDTAAEGRLRAKIKEAEKRIESLREEVNEDETNYNAVLSLESLIRFKKQLETELEEYKNE